MTELKTLKDLKRYYFDGYKHLNELELKAEAVKWIKNDREKFGLFKDGMPEITREWMNRLNITEEELKNEKNKTK